LIELMVAMMITLFVSGAIFGLLTAGQNAFRREPELADRQQNTRLAMDLISRDVVSGGNGMMAFIQAFTDNLNGAGPAGPGGANTDFLEIFANDGSCPTLDVCGSPGGELFTTAPLPSCFGLPTLAYVYGSSGPAGSNGPPGLLYVEEPGPGGGGNCAAGGGGHAGLPSGLSGGINPPGNGACGGGNAFTASNQCQYLASIQVVRYEIYWDPADQNTPSLWRSPMGRTNNGSLNPNPPPNAPWQLVARGIEDLQVRYLTGTGWADNPGAVTSPNYNTIVREVQITLSGRSTAQNIQGATTSALTGAARNAIRGQLVSTVTPRGALLAAQQGNLWR
jgi:hypothetical protein